MRYFDPSYQVRSRPANCEDALLCDLFARHAVHAAMAGKTGVVIGFLHERFIHVPIELLATHTKRLDPASGWWRSVLATTGQPERFNYPRLTTPSGYHSKQVTRCSRKNIRNSAVRLPPMEIKQACSSIISDCGTWEPAFRETSCRAPRRTISTSRSP